MNRSRVLVPGVIILIAILGFSAISLIANRRHSEERSSDTQTSVAQNAPPPNSEIIASEENPVDQDPASTEEKPQTEDGKQAAVEEGRKPDNQRESSARDRPQRRPDGAEGSDAIRNMQSLRMVMGISRIDVNEITPNQAKQILDILTPLRSKSRVTEQEWQQVGANLQKVFTAEQMEAMFRPRTDTQFGRRPDQGSSSDRPTRERPQSAPTDGQRPAMEPRAPREPSSGTRPERPSQPQTETRRDPDLMRDFNPFYSQAPEGDERAEARVKRMDEFFSGLKKRADQR